MSTAKSEKIGVIVGRFQTPAFEYGHDRAIVELLARHKKVVVALGISPVTPSVHNPLGYLDRKEMIRQRFDGEVRVIPIMDVTQDDEWSRNLDEQLSEAFSGKEFVIYGRKSTVVDRYEGIYDAEVLEAEVTTTDKELREIINDWCPTDLGEYNRGVMAATFARYPAAFPTVDIAIFSDGDKQVLLGRKPGEDLWRLPGGFAEPDSESFEDDAIREAEEETTVKITYPEYVGSFKGKDWRYQLEDDKIKTLLFTAKVESGTPQAADDLDEVRWFDLDEVTLDQIIESHHVLIEALRSRSEA